MSDRHARRRSLLDPMTRFWTEDRGLSVFLVLLIVSIFVLPPLVPPGSGHSAPGDVLFALLLSSWIVPVTRLIAELGTLLCLLLLLGMIWAAAHDLLEMLRPGSFAGPVNVVDGARAWFYFSFTTLTMTGYGDVLPVHPVARSLAMLESVTGSLFLTILLARLLSLATSA